MEILAVFTPLITFLLTGLFGRQMGDRAAQLITCTGMFIAAFASLVLFFDVIMESDPRTIALAHWITAGDFSIEWALRVDQLAVVMMCVINIISACVHVYSIGYMSHDPCRARFMSYLSLFTFAMLMLVTADNLLQLFFGWEGVGLASYLLIGFWNEKASANAAAIKAFVVNRIGDFGLALGTMAAFFVFGSIQFDAIFNNVADHAGDSFVFLGHAFPALNLICILLFIGACGKSAQLGLHTWLPDAMEGPTPVSALIHAATMVTAGVFLVARFSPVFEYAPLARDVVCITGALTAFVAATIALTQFDIKRVIAYSTMSQLGYMFFALGVSAYNAALFHLMTHAFFKALLFLSAGSVIHALSGEQDMRKMGGIAKLIPFTHVLMWIGSLALAGIPFLSGYYSKDIIIEAAFSAHSGPGLFAFLMGSAAAFMTAFYSWRLIFLVFYGQPRADHHVMEHIHESPPIMLSPLVVLATGAIFCGALFYEPFVAGDYNEPEVLASAEPDIEIEREVEAPVVEEVPDESVWNYRAFLDETTRAHPENDSLEAAHHVPEWVKLEPFILSLAGIALAWVVYIRRRGLAEKIAASVGPLYRLSLNKWYFDELYDRAVTRNALRLGRLFSTTGDRKLIDRLGPDGTAALSRRTGALLSRFQTGYMYHYALVMITGLLGLISWFIYKIGL